MILDCGGYFGWICDRCGCNDEDVTFSTESDAEKYENENGKYCEFCRMILDTCGVYPKDISMDNIDVTEWWDNRAEKRRER
jgi:hypothetical protein